jgi:hypothetical protein
VQVQPPGAEEEEQGGFFLFSLGEDFDIVPVTVSWGLVVCGQLKKELGLFSFYAALAPNIQFYFYRIDRKVMGA